MIAFICPSFVICHSSLPRLAAYFSASQLPRFSAGGSAALRSYRQAPRPRRGNVHGGNFRFRRRGRCRYAADATERVPPIRHCNLWLLTSQPLSFPASQLGGFAALRSYRQAPRPRCARERSWGITFDKPRRGEGTQTGASVAQPPESSKGTLALKGRRKTTRHGEWR